MSFYLKELTMIYNLDGLTLKELLDKIFHRLVFICGGNSHLTNRFCDIVIDLTTIPKITLEPPLRSVGSSAISSLMIYVHEPNSIVLVVIGCVKESHIGQKMI